MNNIPYLMLDFDGVMATNHQYYSKKRHPHFDNVYPFDPKCVGVLNSIINEVNPVIICSSDWKYHYGLHQLNEIFKWNGIKGSVSDLTGSSWGVQFTSMMQLEECRAFEINKYVREHNIVNFVAVDDLDLSPWIPNNFVRCIRANEGIKQTGIKQKIINILNKN